MNRDQIEEKLTGIFREVFLEPTLKLADDTSESNRSESPCTCVRNFGDEGGFEKRFEGIEMIRHWTYSHS